MSDLLISAGSVPETDAALVKRVTGVEMSGPDATAACDLLRRTIAACPASAGLDLDAELELLLDYIRPRPRPPAHPGCAGWPLE